MWRRNQQAGEQDQLGASAPVALLLVDSTGSITYRNKAALDLGARVLSSPYSMGNGAAIKRGAREATGDVLMFMDADGQGNRAFDKKRSFKKAGFTKKSAKKAG